MECRPGCGACCIAPSINSSLPGMPDGKPAGVVCVNLDPDSHLCRLWGEPDYPDVCKRFQAEPSSCGESADQAMVLIARMETDTG